MKRHTETRTRAKELRKNLTEPERRLWYHLRANRLGVKFQKQAVLAPYIADFAARSHRLVIELDGVLRAILIALGSDPESPHLLQGKREMRGEAERGRGGR